MIKKDITILKCLHKKSFKNFARIQLVKKCSCFFCFKIMKSKEIQEWTDDGKTAICPYCHVDSIIPMEIRQDILKDMAEYFFNGHEKTCLQGKEIVIL